MIRNPEAYEKLTDEIDTAVSNRLLSLPVKYNEAIKLPYLRACINEGMRLYPIVGLGMPREVPSSVVTINGCHIPEKYIVGINPAVVQHGTDWFGPDAEQ